MEIVKSGNNNWKATDWVTSTDISGTGTTEVTSDNLFIYLPAEPLVDWVIQIQRKLNVTAGTGIVESYARIFGQNNDGVSNLGDSSPHYITGDDIDDANNDRVRNIYLKLNKIKGYRATSQERLLIQVYGKGSETDTEWNVKDIQARILYLPLA